LASFYNFFVVFVLKFGYFSDEDEKKQKKTKKRAKNKVCLYVSTKNIKTYHILILTITLLIVK